MLKAAMTAGEAVQAVRGRWPTAREDSEILALLRTCENTVRTTVCGLDGVDTREADAALTAPEPYTGLYLHYAAAHLAQLEGESARYNEELALFYGVWNDFVTAYRRENLPADRCAAGFANRGVRG